MAKIGVGHPPLMAALRELGIVTENAQRVVIDIRVGHPPMVYVLLIGTDGIVPVVEAMKDAHVVTVGLDTTTEDTEEEEEEVTTGG
jgi:hypothetical protein